jgi:prepilin-type N-terminal cleavage/methylation domain-containing protein
MFLDASGFYLWGAHAFRVLVSVFHRNNLSCRRVASQKKFATAGTPSPARRMRALPRVRIRAFTLIELLIVMAIIIVLAGLILATASYVQKKGYRSRAEAEIAAISAALENYKADNGVYPRGNANVANTSSPYDTDKLNPRTDGSAGATYQVASLYLYRALTGDDNFNRQADPGEAGKAYLTFKPNQLSPTDQTANVLFIRDPFGNSYGYSTAYQNNSNQGYNPTFDLWSTAGLTTDPPTTGTDTITPQWIKNW